MSRNQYGLSRHIPTDIALQIRQRSRFGCVICRCAIYQYEHVDPKFVDAKEHDPDRICLLCGACHDRVTRGRISKETVLNQYRNIQQNLDVARPYEELDLATRNISVVLGTASFRGSKSLIQINNEELLSIASPKDGAGFPTISGVFCNVRGNEIFRIKENVWEGPLDVWDVSVVGRTVSIKADGDRLALVFEVEPPEVIRFRYMNMYKDNCHIVCDAEKLLVGQVYEGTSTYIGLGNFKCAGANPGVSVDSRKIKSPKLSGVRIIGGEGVLLDGTGIKVAVGAAQMWIQQMKVWLHK